MSYRIFIVVSIWLISAAISTQFAQSYGGVDSKGISAINFDKENGIITSEEALLQKFYFGFEKQNLNPKYIFENDIPSKCGTEIMWEYQKVRNTITDFTRNEIERILSRKTSISLTSEVYISPSGIFEIEYDVDGINAVSSEDNDRSGIPDYVENIADIFDYCWSFTIDTLGYLPPPLTNSTYKISFEDMEYYGYTQSAGNKATYIVMHNSFNGFPPNNDPESNEIGAAKVTAIHEFKHAVQRIYNNWDDPVWFIELDATWMEDIGYDYINDYYNYLSASQIRQPSRGFSGGSGYEDCLWMHYLSQKFGTNVNREIWERIEANNESIYTSFEMVLNSYQSDFSGALSEYFTWNFLCGEYYDSSLSTYEEAELYPSPYFCDGIITIPDSGIGCAQSALSALFLYFEPASEKGYYDLIMNTNIDNTDLHIFHKYTDGNIELLQIEKVNNQFTLTSEIELADLEYVTLIPVISEQSALNIEIDYNMGVFRTVLFEHTALTDTENPGDIPIILNLKTPRDLAIRDSLKLHYKIGAGEYIVQQMTQGVDENEYAGLIPDPGYEVEISYYFSIYDSLKVYSYYPENAPNEAITFYIGVDAEAPVIMYQDNHQVLSKYNFPFQIIAEISDNLGIDSAVVEYVIGDLDNVYVEKLNQTNLGYYKAEISIDTSFVKPGDVFGYRIIATDSSGSGNVSYFPDSSLKEILIEDASLYKTMPNLIIPDNSNISFRDTITVNENILISDLDIVLKATHERISDLEIRLKPPVGSVKILLKQPGLGTEYGNASNPNIILDNEALYSMNDFVVFDSTTTTGTYKPSHMNLTALNEKSALGNWILYVYDRAEGNTGSIDEWGLIIRGETVTGIEDKQNIVEEFRLHQNYPNPFNPSTKIRFQIPEAQHVELKVFDILGKEIAILLSDEMAPGDHSVEFNAISTNLSIGSGVYFYRLVTESFTQVKKMLLLR